MSMDIYDSKVQARMKPKDGSPDPLADSVDELKRLFKREFEDNSDLYDRRDYDRLMDSDDDWQARRWVIYQRDVPRAYELLVNTMRWRKELDLNNLNHEDFPREFYELGWSFQYGQDRLGRGVMYVRCGLFKPMGEMSKLYENYCTFMFDQCDKRFKSCGFIMVYDMTGTGLSNVDMANVKFTLSLKDRFPLACRLILLGGLSWVLSPIYKAVLNLIPASQAAIFKIVNLDELNQYIEDHQMPLKMGGTSKAKVQAIPRDAKSITEFQSVDKSCAMKFKKYVQSKTDSNDFEIVQSKEVLR